MSQLYDNTIIGWSYDQQKLREITDLSLVSNNDLPKPKYNKKDRLTKRNTITLLHIGVDDSFDTITFGGYSQQLLLSIVPNRA